VPTAVEAIVQRTELFSSYTPYQPEISQGMLQALFEYQSMICAITATEVANCSMYDWASALGEAVRMAARLTHRTEALVPEIIHPERMMTLAAYTKPASIAINSIGYEGGTGLLNTEELKASITERTAAVYIENPTYLGFIETQVDEIAEIAHDHGALFIVGVDPLSLGILRPPGEYGADIVVGEGQALGNPLNYGGPMLGIFACRDDLQLIRQMPGRTIGMTRTADGKQRGFCMALQTREQHIRREKATSNICSNESLCAVAAAVYLALLGPTGLRELGETIMCKTRYAIDRMAEVDGVNTPLFTSPHFKEFTVNFDHAGQTVHDVHENLLQRQVHGGISLCQDFPELGETALYCTTEIHSKEDIDYLCQALKTILGEKA
jgi:glycine dehydrogenase subunit 1